jgi:glycosyltransferase involved in cell wall biosynthesis
MSNPMHVVIVCDYGDVNGGAAKVAVTSARGLAEAGIPVTYVCAFGPVSPALDHPGIEVRSLGFENVWNRRNPLAAAAQGIWNGRAERALAAVLEPLPDETVVHFHQWSKALSPSVLVSPRRRGFPSLVSLHDYFIACPNGAYYRFPQETPCDLAPMSRGCIAANCDRTSYAHKLVRLARQAATSAALARCGEKLSILNVSPFAAAVVDRFVPKRHRRFTVRSPVDTPRKPAVPAARNRDFVFVGRLTEEKGVRMLAEVAHAAHLPLTIAGDGPLLGELRKIGGTVRCTGWLDSAGLEAVLDRARALVFPSGWYETGGLVVLEALARGIPVVVSRKTAPADFVFDGVNGFVIDSGDSTALHARLRILEDDSVVARMAAQAYRRYWDEPQTSEVHTKNLTAVYRELLSEPMQ